MTRPTLIRLALAALLLLPLAAPAAGDSSPEAREWLEKLLSIYDRGPFKVGYSATLDLSASGQPISGSLKGQLTQRDRTHSRMNMEMEMSSLPGMSTEPVTMRMLNVTDGSVVWTEIENPALGGTQVTRVSLDQLAELGASMGGLSPSTMDLVGQMEAMTETLDFEILEQDERTVTLRGRVTDKALAQLGGSLTAAGVETFLFVLDARTGFPREVRAEGENPFLAMSFHDLVFVDPATLPAELFEYTPAEGVSVMDLGAVLQAHQGQ